MANWGMMRRAVLAASTGQNAMIALAALLAGSPGSC